MKKLLAILTVMCMVLTTLVVPTVVFGTDELNMEEASNPERVIVGFEPGYYGDYSEFEFEGICGESIFTGGYTTDMIVGQTVSEIYDIVIEPSSGISGEIFKGWRKHKLVDFNDRFEVGDPVSDDIYTTNQVLEMKVTSENVFFVGVWEGVQNNPGQGSGYEDSDILFYESVVEITDEEGKAFAKETGDPIRQLHANKSLTAGKTYFYIKYPKKNGAENNTLQYKVGSRHMLKIGEDEEGEGGEDYTVWRMESSVSNEPISYYDYNDDAAPLDEPALVSAFNQEFAGATPIESVLNYINIGVDLSAPDDEYALKKVTLKKSNNKEFRGSEDFLFMFYLDGEPEKKNTLEINYGVEIMYDPDAIKDLDTESTAFYKLCNIDTDSEIVRESTDESGIKTVFLSQLGSLSSGRSDLRHGVGTDLWIDLNDGYQITGIYDSHTETELPYTASLINYFKVYDGPKNTDGSNEVKIEELEEDKAWGGMSTIGSGEEGKEDEIIASAYTTSQSLAKGTAKNEWAKSDESWDWFNIGDEDTAYFYDWCKENGYTSELMGTHLTYQIYMPVEEKCKIRIETAEASSINDFRQAVTNSVVKYSGNINNFESNVVNLSVIDKFKVNNKLEDYYGDDAEVIDVYEFKGDINGVANIAIPITDSNKYEVVWISDVETKNNEGEVISSDLSPVPMLSVNTSNNDAKVVPTGHFSKYAIVGKSTGNGGTTGPEVAVEVGEVPTIDTSNPADKVEIGTDVSTSEVVSETTEAIVDAILDGENVTEIAENVVTAITTAIRDGKNVDIVTSVEAEVVEETAVKPDDVLLVEGKAGEDTIVQYLDLSVIMTVLVDGQSPESCNLTELVDEVTFTIAIPDELKAVAEDDTKEFYVIRVHGDNVVKLPVTVNDNGTLSFKTDKFSTYALAYGDVDFSDDPGQDGDNGTTGDGSGSTGSSDGVAGGVGSAEKAPDKAVDTGDNFNAVPFIAAMAIALAGVAAAIFRRRTVK